MDFLSHLQEKLAYHNSWTPFCFTYFDNNNGIRVYKFICKNEDEKRMYDQFCCLAIPQLKKWHEYYNYKSDDVGFTHLVGLNQIYYYVSFLKNDNNFNADQELVVFQRLYDKFKLKFKRWPPFNYVTEKAPSWLDYHFEFIVYSKKEKY